MWTASSPKQSNERCLSLSRCATAAGCTDETCGEAYCSWACLLMVAASVATMEEIEDHPWITVEELPDFRAGRSDDAPR